MHLCGAGWRLPFFAAALLALLLVPLVRAFVPLGAPAGRMARGGGGFGGGGGSFGVGGGSGGGGGLGGGGGGGSFGGGGGGGSGGGGGLGGGGSGGGGGMGGFGGFGGFGGRVGDGGAARRAWSSAHLLFRDASRNRTLRLITLQAAKAAPYHRLQP